MMEDIWDRVPGGRPVRPLEERVAEDDKRRVSEFSQGMLERWIKGRKTYGPDTKIDPFQEAYDECLDLANYVLEIYFRLRELERRLNLQAEVLRTAGDVYGRDTLEGV